MQDPQLTWSNQQIQAAPHQYLEEKRKYNRWREQQREQQAREADLEAYTRSRNRQAEAAAETAAETENRERVEAAQRHIGSLL